MAADLSKSLVHLDGVLKDSKLQNTCRKTNVKVETGVKTPTNKSAQNKENKSGCCRKSNVKAAKTPTTKSVSCGKSNVKAETRGKASTTKSSQKENMNKGKVETKKPTAQGRQSLACRNTNVKTPKRSIASPAGKKSAAPVTRSKSLKPVSCPCQPNEPKKEQLTRPKIIVYRDSPGVVTTGKKATKNRVGLSKSWDSSSMAKRKSVPVTSKCSELTVPGTMKASSSVPDLTSTISPKRTEKSVAGSKKSPSKTGKSPTVGKKSPSKTKPRLPRIKQGQFEFDEMVTKLESMFPNADPVFLRSQFVKFGGSVTETIEFIIMKEKMGELPTRDEYVRRAEAERLQNKFLGNFSVETFLKFIPDPWEYFLKTEKHNSATYLDHSLHYLKGKYRRHYLKAIHSALEQCGYSLYLADKELRKKNRLLKMRTTNRSRYECDAGRPTTFNIQFVHEVAFIENETQIKSYIKKAEAERYKKFKEAENAGTLLKCESCNDFTLLQNDAVNCPANHVFCKDCVVKWVGMEIQNGSFQFKCLMNCGERYSIESLQNILSPFVMAKIIRRHQLEEIEASGIENLAYCPFCFYMAVLPPEITVFKCLNPSCMTESCRLCKQPSHIPLKCQELEKLESKILKLEIDMQYDKEEEDKSFKCTDCSAELFKIEDSAQLVCSCGTTICSDCRRPFRECQHSDASPHSMSPSLDDDSDSSDSSDIDDDTDADKAGNAGNAGNTGNAGDTAEGKSSEQFLPVEFFPSESDVF